MSIRIVIFLLYKQGILMLSMLGKNFSKQHFEIYFIFSQKKGLDIPCN